MRGTPASVFLIMIILLIVIPPATEAGPGWIIGRVTDANSGQPIAKVSVVIPGTLHTNLTNAGGWFSFYDIENGNYELVFSCDGYRITTTGKMRVKAGFTYALPVRLEALRDGESIYTTTMIYACGNLRGRLTDSATGDPIVGAWVILAGTSLTAKTNSDGQFGIIGLDAGSYEVKISHRDYMMTPTENVEVKREQTTQLTRQLTRWDRKAHFETYDGGVTDTSETLWNTNKITMSKEAIQTQPVNTVEELMEQVSGVAINAEGVIFIGGGRTGELADSSGVPPNPGPWAGMRGANKHNPSATPHSIAGHISDEESHVPLGDVTVMVVGTKFITLTDAHGNFSIKNIPDGCYEIVVSCKGYKPRKISQIIVRYESGSRIPVSLEKIDRGGDRIKPRN